MQACRSSEWGGTRCFLKCNGSTAEAFMNNAGYGAHLSTLKSFLYDSCRLQGSAALRRCTVPYGKARPRVADLHAVVLLFGLRPAVDLPG